MFLLQFKGEEDNTERTLLKMYDGGRELESINTDMH